MIITMDYEKKYKDALEIARNIRFSNPSSATANVVCEEIFPELKKSEDEKIRIFINNSLCFIPDVVWENNNVTKEELIAWIEKQGEPQPYWKPTEEQLQTLEETIEYDAADANVVVLRTLYNNLKKL